MNESKKEHVCAECNKEFEFVRDYADHVIATHPITEKFIKDLICNNSSQRLEITHLNAYIDELEWELEKETNTFE